MDGSLCTERFDEVGLISIDQPAQTGMDGRALHQDRRHEQLEPERVELVPWCGVSNEIGLVYRHVQIA